MPPAAPSPPPDRCPRCHGAFSCEIATGSCWCAAVTLTPDRQAELAAAFDGCLCPRCMRELRATSPDTQPLH